MAQAWIKAMVVALGLAPALVACQSDGMSALAPNASLRAPATPLAIVGVSGPAPEIAQRFEGILAQEARKRGFEVVAAGTAGPALRVKTYLDAFQGQDGKAGFSWVLETSENGRTRTGQVRGAAALGTATAAPWQAFDDAAMRQIAQMSVNDLIRLASGAPAAGSTAALQASSDEAQ